MKLTLVIIGIIFLAGLYVTLNYNKDSLEGFQPRCPNILIQNGDELWLKNTSLAEVPGVNPVVFHNLEEYTEFVLWQRSKGIQCPILYLQKNYDAQNQEVYKFLPPPEPLVDAGRDSPTFNRNSYPGIDQTNQTIGQNTLLDKYHEVGQTQPVSANAMDPNWGGSDYSVAAVNAGNYIGNEVYKP